MVGRTVGRTDRIVTNARLILENNGLPSSLFFSFHQDIKIKPKCIYIVIFRLGQFRKECIVYIIKFEGKPYPACLLSKIVYTTSTVT